MFPFKIILLCFVVFVCYCEANTLTGIENEVRQLENELKKIENQADAKKVVSFDNFALSKKELQDALKAKKDSQLINSNRIKQIEEDRRELEKLAFEKMLLEDEPIVENTPISKEKKEIYDLMNQMMEDSTADKYNKVDDHELRCKDQYKQCSRAKDKCHQDTRKKFMKQFCNATCEYCKTPAPKPCSGSQYGCCWDRETTKLNYDGINCPACIDHYTRLCPEFEADCLDNNISGHFMRKFCPITCKLCGVTKLSCFDSPGLEDQCQLWKENNWCITRPSVTNFHCKFTCRKCTL